MKKIAYFDRSTGKCIATSDDGDNIHTAEFEEELREVGVATAIIDSSELPITLGELEKGKRRYVFGAGRPGYPYHDAFAFVDLPRQKDVAAELVRLVGALSFVGEDLALTADVEYDSPEDVCGARLTIHRDADGKSGPFGWDWLIASLIPVSE